jgi:hypothetical protein
MPNYNKTKGNKFEKEVLHALRLNKIKAQRVVASGSVKEDSGDIVMTFQDTPYNVECKFYKDLPIAGLEKFKGDNDIVIMRQNRDVAKVYMDFDTLLGLLVLTRK